MAKNKKSKRKERVDRRVMGPRINVRPAAMEPLPPLTPRLQQPPAPLSPGAPPSPRTAPLSPREQPLSPRELLAPGQAAAEVIAALSHPNITEIVGAEAATTAEGLPAVITRHADRGSVAKVLLEARAAFEAANGAGTPPPAALSMQQRLEFARDAAQGMEYLTNHGRHHNHLKSANLLVFGTRKLVVKVADYQLPPTANPAEDALPYMAPELLENMDGEGGGEKSDVYAWAIILWELLTLEQAWGDKGVSEVVYLVTNNSRPPEPQNTRAALRCFQEDAFFPQFNLHFKQVMQLMRRCWDPIRYTRPTFKEIAEELG